MIVPFTVPSKRYSLFSRIRAITVLNFACLLLESASNDRTFSIFAEESFISPANLAECTPGIPPKAVISKPVSSAKTFNPEALWTNLALARALPSIRGSSSGISSWMLISERLRSLKLVPRREFISLILCSLFEANTKVI